MRLLLCPLLISVVAGCAGDPSPPPNRSDGPAATGHTLVMIPQADAAEGGINAGVALNALSVPELRNCVSLKVQIQENDAKSAKEKQDLDARRTQVAAREAAIADARAKVVASSKASVDAFNAKVHAALASTNSFNTDVAAANARQIQRNQVIRQFDTTCAGHSYYSDDLATVEKEFPTVDLSR